MKIIRLYIFSVVAFILPFNGSLAAQPKGHTTHTEEAFMDATEELFALCLVYYVKTNTWPESQEQLMEWEKESSETTIEWDKTAGIEIIKGTENRLIIFQRDKRGKPERGICLRMKMDGNLEVLNTMKASRYMLKEKKKIN